MSLTNCAMVSVGSQAITWQRSLVHNACAELSIISRCRQSAQWKSSMITNSKAGMLTRVVYQPFTTFDARRYRVAVTLVTALRWLIVNSTSRA
jgi:hypothetical protein